MIKMKTFTWNSSVALLSPTSLFNKNFVQNLVQKSFVQRYFGKQKNGKNKLEKKLKSIKKWQENVYFFIKSFVKKMFVKKMCGEKKVCQKKVWS